MPIFQDDCDDWRYLHDAAADTIRTLWGVTGVPNQVGIKPKANAGDIKSSILTALNRSRLDSEHIDIASVNGNCGILA